MLKRHCESCGGGLGRKRKATRFCSIQCFASTRKGISLSNEFKEKVRIGIFKWIKENPHKIKQGAEKKRGRVSPRKGVVLSEEIRQKISNSRKGKAIKEDHYMWKKDRSTLAKKQERNDGAYKEWRRQVWLRDKFKCALKSEECRGKIEAHHIHKWSDYEELRYQANNGITLCHFHHPRKVEEEKRLIPTFERLVSVSSG